MEVTIWNHISTIKNVFPLSAYYFALCYLNDLQNEYLFRNDLFQHTLMLIIVVHFWMHGIRHAGESLHSLPLGQFCPYLNKQYCPLGQTGSVSATRSTVFMQKCCHMSSTVYGPLRWIPADQAFGLLPAVSWKRDPVFQSKPESVGQPLVGIGNP